MRKLRLSLLFVPFAFTHAQNEHGKGEEGSSMGPVAFLWPPDRPWTARTDNIGPCGSPDGPSNRTSFPLSQGSVALTIADDAWHVAFRLAVADNPTAQTDFDDQVVDNITDVDPGHQCYKLEALDNIATGTNATIQLEYWAEYEGENNGKNQSFFACADITFVEPASFTAQVPCFNVTSDEFGMPTPTTSNGAPSPTEVIPQTPSEGSTSSNGGLSNGAKAGVAVGSILGGLGLIGFVAFFVWRRGKSAGLRGKEEYELRAKNLNEQPVEH